MCLTLQIMNNFNISSNTNYGNCLSAFVPTFSIMSILPVRRFCNNSVQAQRQTLFISRNLKCKGKGHPRTGHEDPEGE